LAREIDPDFTALENRKSIVMFYSQFGEDRILSRIFDTDRRGVCVEVGANNGIDGSTTLYFEQRGWECVLVEPNPTLCQELRRTRNAQIFQCAASSQPGVATLQIAVGEEFAHAVSALGGAFEADQIMKEHGFKTYALQVRTQKLDDILDEAQLSGNIDFISIDVEGHELELLAGFTPSRWLPTILIIEDNGAWWQWGVSKYLAAFDYVRFKRTGVNDWYAHRRNRQLIKPGSPIGYFLSALVGRSHAIALRIEARVNRVPILRKLYNIFRRMIGRRPIS
jgi:FkbM family methyltransferase